MSTGNVGIFNTGNFTTDLAAKSFAGMITRLMPNGQAPLFGLTSMLPTETALQVEHGFFTKTMIFPSFNLDAAVADGAATTFTVASTSNLLPGMIMQATSTGENVIINSVLSSTQITVTRGVGNVAAAAVADDVNFYQVGNAFEESSVRPNALQITPVRVTNYTQIFRNTWALSGSAQATEVIAGDSTVAENRMDCASFHAADIEKALIFGQKSTGTRNGQPFRTMDGLISILSNLTYYPASYAAVNLTTAGATTTFTQLETALDPVFNQATDPKAGNERILLVGGAARKVINNIGRLNATYYIQNGATSYGLQFGSFNIARGSFRMIEHPLFNSNSDWSKYALCVDLSTFRVAYLGGRKTMKSEFNDAGSEATDNGIDAVGGTLTTELTCVVKNPPANALIKNLTAAAAG
jgi:Family of unknown function (DUF5309)